MNTIREHGADGYKIHGTSGFEKRFCEICENQQRDNRALFFAFLLYDFNSPLVTKVMQDQAYWTALDETSGEFVTVFAFHSPTDGEATVEQDRLPKFGDSVGQVLKEHFDADDVTMPALLFFQVSGGNVIGEHLVKIQAESVDGVFGEIHSVINCAVQAVEQVVPENKGNVAEIFDLVSQMLRRRDNIHLVSRLGKRALTLRAYAKLLGALIP